MRLATAAKYAVSLSNCIPVPDCPLPIDVVFISSDQASIGAHKANLDHFSDGFPSPDAVQSSEGAEAVHLVEDGATLKLLFQFMHKARFPKVHNLDAEQPSSLAEASEKYMVYSAMSVCSDRIE